MSYYERLRLYEAEKRELQAKDLPYKEYEMEIKKLVDNTRFRGAI